MNIFDETLVIVVESANVGGVYSVNGKAGYVTLDKSDIGLSNVENISIVETSGYLQNQIDSNTIIGDFVYLTGNQTISGVKTFITRPQVNGTGVLLSGEGFEKQTKLFDYVTGVPIYMYVGSAPFNSSQNDNVWEIYRTQIDQNGLVSSNLLAENVTWTGRYFENYM